MSRTKADVFKKFGKEELFVIGDDDESRAKILYVRSGNKPQTIAKRLSEWGGVDIPKERIKEWAWKGRWGELRKRWKLSYELKDAERNAESVADADADGQQVIREVYAQLSAEVTQMVLQKIKYNKPKYATAGIVSTKEISELAMALKTLSEVHFRALGIAEVAVVDPTVGNEQIRIMTKQDIKRIDNKSDG